VPLSRQAFAVLGSQPSGHWGYVCGVNEHRVAAGCLRLPAALPLSQPGLLGTDLVRLILERCHTALQAVDLLTSLISRHGQGAFPACPDAAAHDNAILLADAHEAYVVEAAGQHWAHQEIQEIRAVCPARVIRQDWDRISPGLAAEAIARGLWPEDGSKLDFAGVFSHDQAESRHTLQHWGRVTLSLQEYNGQLDLPLLQRLLAGQLDTPLPDPVANAHAPVAGFTTVLSAEREVSPAAWCAFGAPSCTLYFPVYLEGELPPAFTEPGHEITGTLFWWRLKRLGEILALCPDEQERVRAACGRLQSRFEQEAEEFCDEAVRWQQLGDRAELRRQANFLMEHHLELFEELAGEVLELQPASLVE
jgi:dipeptidase